MSWTKRQFVMQAFDEAGLAAYAFDLEPEQLQSALRKLDGMMASWNAQSIRLGYPIPSSPENSDLDQETGVPDAANEAIYTALAIRIAPGFGKSVSQDARITAKQAFDALMSWVAGEPSKRQFPSGTFAGAGNKQQVFLTPPTESLLAGSGDPLDFN